MKTEQKDTHTSAFLKDAVKARQGGRAGSEQVFTTWEKEQPTAKKIISYYKKYARVHHLTLIWVKKGKEIIYFKEWK